MNRNKPAAANMVWTTQRPFLTPSAVPEGSGEQGTQREHAEGEKTHGGGRCLGSLDLDESVGTAAGGPLDQRPVSLYVTTRRSVSFPS